MADQVIARFLVDHPVRPGMVRAILDTLSAQGGAYQPQLVRRASEEGFRRIAWSRPTGLLDEVGEGGSQTTFLRVAEGQPEPLLTFQVSATPRAKPSRVTLAIPAGALATSDAVEQILGVCKGLYLFLEAPWGTVGLSDKPAVSRDGPAPSIIQWANFFGPQVVGYTGPARLLTSMAFMVEILPDGGIMLVTHPTPGLACTAEGLALRLHLEESTGVARALEATLGRAAADIRAGSAEFQGARRRQPGPPR